MVTDRLQELRQSALNNKNEKHICIDYLRHAPVAVISIDRIPEHPPFYSAAGGAVIVSLNIENL